MTPIGAGGPVLGRVFETRALHTTGAGPAQYRRIRPFHMTEGLSCTPDNRSSVMKQRRSLIVVLLPAFLAAVATLACRDEATTGPEVTDVQLAKRTMQDPEVTATDPPGAPRDTTLDVEVSGSGFDNGSTVELTLAGVPTEKVRTNSTRYRNSRTLIANITIAADAEVDLYDVEVTTASRKKGIGTEMFEVFYKVKGTPTETIDFLEPGPEDSPELYDLRSSAQPMWGAKNGKKQELNLDMDPFELTFAFSERDLDPSTWAYVTDPEEKAECEEISRRLSRFQEQPQPLVGAFYFLYDVGGSMSSTTVWFETVVGDYRYTVRNWACTTCIRDGHPTLTVSESTQGDVHATSFHVTGASLQILRYPADDPWGKRQDPDPQTCRRALLDYVLTVNR
jgi:hypothetical protein